MADPRCARRARRAASGALAIDRHPLCRPPSSVAVELLNEPHQAMDAGRWNQLLPATWAAVRDSNPARKIIIGTAPMNDAPALDQLALPDVTATVHYCESMSFTHQGADWMDGPVPQLGARWASSVVTTGRRRRTGLPGPATSAANWTGSSWSGATETWRRLRRARPPRGDDADLTAQCSAAPPSHEQLIKFARSKPRAEIGLRRCNSHHLGGRASQAADASASPGGPSGRQAGSAVGGAVLLSGVPGVGVPPGHVLPPGPVPVGVEVEEGVPAADEGGGDIDG